MAKDGTGSAIDPDAELYAALRAEWPEPEWPEPTPGEFFERGNAAEMIDQACEHLRAVAAVAMPNPSMATRELASRASAYVGRIAGAIEWVTTVQVLGKFRRQTTKQREP